MRRKSPGSFLSLALALAGLVWLGDYIRRRVRARNLFARSRERVGQVSVETVISREAQDQLSREGLLAKLPASTRYYDHRRYELAWSCIPTSLRNARFLDAGCGDGYILQETRKRFPTQFQTLCGLDISHYKTIRARARLGENAALAVANVEALPFRDASFDVILCTEVLEHLLSVEPGIAELARLCAPGGRVILSTPSRQPMFWSYTNPLTWLEAIAGLWNPALLPPFHNLERPGDPHSVVHRAFTQRELESYLRAFASVQIVSTQFRLPGIAYQVIPDAARIEQIETLVARIPVLNLLGETWIVCTTKA